MMRIHKKTTGLLSTAIAAILLLGVAPPASAVGGESSEAIQGVANVPQNGVIYPVIRWKNFYKVNASEPTRLTPGVTNTLSTSSSRSTTNTVTGTTQQSATIKWAIPLLKMLLAGIDTGWQSSETYTDSTTSRVAFTYG